jgi:hypothetical protein
VLVGERGFPKGGADVSGWLAAFDAGRKAMAEGK